MSGTLDEILHTAADVTVDLLGLSGAVTPERLLRNRRKDLLKALSEDVVFRCAVREVFAARDARDVRKTRAAAPDAVRAVASDAEADLARLILHDDPEIHRIGLREARRLETGRDDREIKRLKRNQSDLRGRLTQERGRKEHTVQELARVREQLALAMSEHAESEERNEALSEELRSLRRRLKDQRSLAATLRTLVTTRTAPPSDAAVRDPRSGADTARDPRSGADTARDRRTDADGDERSALATACAGAGVEETAFLRVLELLVDPAPPPRLETVERDLRVTVLGGGTEIGGSCVLIEAGRTRLLVDAGIRQGGFPAAPPEVAKALDGRLDAVIVTHAHMDHCGYVPALASRKPEARLIATRETTHLMPVMWRDSVKVMERRVADDEPWGTRRAPLYGRAEVATAVERLEETPFGRPIRVGDIELELFPAGHILGAAGVVARAGDQRVVVSGDISGFRQESVDGHVLPESARGADLLLLETTCCGDRHDPRETRVNDLISAVEEVWRNHGLVLIPAFALGRAQEVALLLRKHLPQVPLLVDGMARELSELFEQVTEGSASPLSVFGDNVRPARRPFDLHRFRTGVVITTSGMLNGGPAVQWAAEVLPNPNSALFVSGYQDEESGGRRLLALAESGGGEFELDVHGVRKHVTVRAGVRPMKLSAHADRTALSEIVDELAPRRTMLVHGLPARQRKFAELLRVRRHDVVRTGAWWAH